LAADKPLAPVWYRHFGAVALGHLRRIRLSLMDLTDEKVAGLMRHLRQSIDYARYRSRRGSIL
jgi:hypothetical protein